MNRLKNVFDEKFVKFIGVGVINTAIGTSVMFGLYNIFKCNYWVASGANYIVGSFVSYILNKYFTFKNSDSNKRTVIKFILNIGICYIISYGLAKPIIVLILNGTSQSIRDNISMFLGMIFFTMFNYLGQRYFTFRN